MNADHGIGMRSERREALAGMPVPDLDSVYKSVSIIDMLGLKAGCNIRSRLPLMSFESSNCSARMPAV